MTFMLDEFANVALYDKDSTFLVGTVTDSCGVFVVNCSKNKASYLKVSCVGYCTQIVTVSNEKKYNVTYSNNTIKVKGYEIKINEFTNSKINIDIIKNNKNINIILLENGNINITYNNVKININKTNKNTYEYDFISKNYKVSGKFEIENSTFNLFDKTNYIDKDNLSYNDKMNLNEEFKKLILELFSTTIPNTIMN